MKPKPRSSRRLLQFRLRTLLMLVTAYCVVFGMVIQPWRDAHRKRQFAEEIARRGGYVRLGEPPGATGVISGWLHFFLGDEYFAEAEFVAWILQSEEDLDLLHAFPQLSAIRLVGPAVTDEALERVAGLSQLGELQLDDATVSERGLNSLTELSNLRYLEFSECSLPVKGGDRGLGLLTKLPQLSHLAFADCSLSDDALRVLYDAPALVELRLQESNVTEAAILAIRRANPALTVKFGGRASHVGSTWGLNCLPSVHELPHATALAFEGPLPTDATLNVLEDARSLTSLRISQCPVTDDGLEILRGLTRLTHLDLSGNTPFVQKRTASSGPVRSECRITDRALEHISHLRNLADLSVSHCHITDDGMHYLRALENLTSLHLTGSSITDRGVRELQGLAKLRTLFLPSASIRGHGLAALNKEIKTLYLNRTDVDDSGLAAIAELTSVDQLHVAGTRITDNGVPALARMTSLRHLDVRETAISDAGAAELQQALPDCKILR